MKEITELLIGLAIELLFVVVRVFVLMLIWNSVIVEIVPALSRIDFLTMASVFVFSNLLVVKSSKDDIN